MNHRLWSFSAKELNVQLTTLAVGIWLFTAFNSFTPGMYSRTARLKGADFVHFYVLGHLVTEGRTDLLYDAEAQRRVQADLVPASEGYWFIPIYGPQTALLFAPFAKLPYLWAAWAWALVTIVSFLACARALWRRCPTLLAHRRLLLPGALAFVPLYVLVSDGQTSIVPLVCLTAGYLGFHADRKWWAGVALGSLIFKPQFGVAVAVVMLVHREWRVIAGSVVGIAAQWGLSAVLLGTGSLMAYFEMLKQGPTLAVALEPKMSLLHSLRAFWLLLLPSSPAASVSYVLSSAAVLAIAVRLWRRPVALESRYSALVLATVLVSPHLGAYDLVLFAPAFILTAAVAESTADVDRRRLRGLLFLAYLVPITNPLTAFVRLQFSVVVFVAWLLALAGLNVGSQKGTEAGGRSAGTVVAS